MERFGKNPSTGVVVGLEADAETQRNHGMILEVLAALDVRLNVLRFLNHVLIEDGFGLARQVRAAGHGHLRKPGEHHAKVEQEGDPPSSAEAETGVQALKVWAQHKNEIDLLLTDMMMPEGVSGVDLATQILAERADLKVLYSSGYSLEVVDPDFVTRPGVNFLQKPYDPETLAQVVRDCLNGVAAP